MPNWAKLISGSRAALASAQAELSGMLGPFPDAPGALTLYHGTPHVFDSFDFANNLRKGEGAMAYGPGGYMTGNRPLAEHYATTLARRLSEPAGSPLASYSGGRKMQGNLSALNKYFLDTQGGGMARDMYGNLSPRGGGRPNNYSLSMESSLDPFTGNVLAKTNGGNRYTGMGYTTFAPGQATSDLNRSGIQAPNPHGTLSGMLAEDKDATLRYLQMKEAMRALDRGIVDPSNGQASNSKIIATPGWAHFLDKVGDPSDFMPETGRARAQLPGGNYLPGGSSDIDWRLTPSNADRAMASGEKLNSMLDPNMDLRLIARGGSAAYKMRPQIYQGQLNASPNQMLLYDRPFAEQSDPIKESIRSLGEQFPRVKALLNNPGHPLMPAGDFVHALPQDATGMKALADAGIPATAYLRAGPRSAGPAATFDPSDYNFVIHNQDILDMLSRTPKAQGGRVGYAAGGAVAKVAEKAIDLGRHLMEGRVAVGVGPKASDVLRLDTPHPWPASAGQDMNDAVRALGDKNPVIANQVGYAESRGYAGGGSVVKLAEALRKMGNPLQQVKNGMGLAKNFNFANDMTQGLAPEGTYSLGMMRPKLDALNQLHSPDGVAIYKPDGTLANEGALRSLAEQSGHTWDAVRPQAGMAHSTLREMLMENPEDVWHVMRLLSGKKLVDNGMFAPNGMALRPYVSGPGLQQYFDAVNMPKVAAQRFPAFTPNNRNQLVDMGQQLKETAGGVDAHVLADKQGWKTGRNELADSLLQDNPGYAEGGAVEPTEGQKKAGNYAKEHRYVGGMRVSIENKAGSVRSGTDKSGNTWQTEMKHDYGYIRGTQGADKDHIDAFFGPGDPVNSPVHVIDQVHPDTGEFDEHKVVFGAQTPEEASAVYHANYEPGWRGADAVSPTTFGDFKKWALDGKAKRKPFADGGPVAKSYAAQRLDELDNIQRGVARGAAGFVGGALGNAEGFGRAVLNALGAKVDPHPVMPDSDYVKSVLPIDAPDDDAGKAAEFGADFGNPVGIVRGAATLPRVIKGALSGLF